MDVSAVFDWSLIESPLGVAGVVAETDGRPLRVILPVAARDEALRRMAEALRALLAAGQPGAGRIEESPVSSGASPQPPALPPGSLARRDGPGAREAARQIGEYLAGRRQRFDLEIEPPGAAGFHREALLAAAAIPYGQTRSYWWVAVRAGNPRAARAVGQAMALNPLPLLVPCHRVVRADGTLGGFGGGNPDLKRRLLELEGALAPEPPDGS